MASKAQLLGIINTQLASNQPILASQHRTQIITMLDELYNAQSRGNVLSGLPLTSLQLANDTFLAFRNGAALQIPFSSIFDDPLTLGTPNGLELDGTVLSLGLASATTTGALSAADFGNFVTIDTAQTITGAKVFSLDSSFNGVHVGRGGGNLQNNTRVGLSALENNTTGSENTAIGLQALENNSTGSFNTANGFQALRQNSTGGDNTANGFSALENNSTGSFNTAFGFSTLENNTTGSSNTAIGVEAGRGLANNTALTVANNSIFIGRNTKAAANNQSNQIVIGNDAIGQGSNTVTIGNSSTILNKFFGTVIHADAVNADESATLGQVNTILGNFVTIDTAQTITAAKVFSQDLFVNNLRVGRGLGFLATIFGNNAGGSSTGAFNTFFGANAGQKNTTGANNTAIGFGALQNNTTGLNSIAIGMQSLRDFTTGFQNTAIGVSAFQLLLSGSNNIAIGRISGRSLADNTDLTVANNSIFLGAETKAALNNQTNQIVIGTEAIGAGSNSVVLGHTTITKTVLRGNVGIGTTDPSVKLDVQGGANTILASFAGIVGRGLRVSTDTASNGRVDCFVKFDAGDSIGQYAFLTAGTERLRITSTGNVGIGTTAPSAKLEVNATSGASGLSIGQSNQTSSQLKAGIGYFVSGVPSVISNGNGLDIGNSTNNPLRIFTNNEERMLITSTGRIQIALEGIPTSDPIIAGQLYRNNIGQLFISLGVS